MPETPPIPDPPVPRKPLPVTITPGMPVIDINDGTAGIIAGVTQAYCIYRVSNKEALVVAAWRDVAVGNLCPADALLPADVAENDHRNAQAAVLRELLALPHFGMTVAQATLLEELVTALCGTLKNDT